jgi:hypothetical protein
MVPILSVTVLDDQGMAIARRARRGKPPDVAAISASRAAMSSVFAS